MFFLKIEKKQDKLGFYLIPFYFLHSFCIWGNLKKIIPQVIFLTINIFVKLRSWKQQIINVDLGMSNETDDSFNFGRKSNDIFFIKFRLNLS